MWFDLFLLLCVAAGIATGAWKGMCWQLAGIGSAVLGFVIGLPVSQGIATGATTFRKFLVFALCYAGISLACFVVAWLLRKKLELVKLHHYDHHMGAFVGAIHGIVLWVIVAMFAIVLSDAARRSILTRPTGRVVGYTLDAAHGILPGGLHEILHPYMHPEGEKPPPKPDESRPHSH
jgi:uncharacterized membrane protein required for colicin V production